MTKVRSFDFRHIVFGAIAATVCYPVRRRSLEQNPNHRPSLADAASQIVHTPGLHVEGCIRPTPRSLYRVNRHLPAPQWAFFYRESVPAFCHALESFNPPNNFVIQHFRGTEHVSVHNNLLIGLLAFTNRIRYWLVGAAGSDLSR